MIWALWSRTQRFLKIAFWKPVFWPNDLLMQPTETFWTTLVRDHVGIIPVKFGRNPIRGFRGADVELKLLTDGGRPRTTVKGLSQYITMSTLCSGELKTLKDPNQFSTISPTYCSNNTRLEIHAELPMNHYQK